MKNTVFPAEWAPQRAVLLTWPHRHGDWGTSLESVERVFVEIALNVTRSERLIVACYDAVEQERILTLLRTAQVDPHRVATSIARSNDVWVRDHGPLTVFEGDTPVLLDFRFNGWGGKYPAELDNALTQRLHAEGVFGSVLLRAVDLVLEGGSVESDGAGTLLVTSHCLLSPARNPSLSREGIEAQLRDWLGVDRVLWLEHGYLEGDDTDGHVDTLVRFCDANTLAYVHCNDPRDEHYSELQAMATELRALRTRDGEPYRLVPLPWPKAILDSRGQRLPATYANFLVINDSVLVPTYSDPRDEEAITALAKCFPGREVIGIDCRALIAQRGSLHCATMQIPAAATERRRERRRGAVL